MLSFRQRNTFAEPVVLYSIISNNIVLKINNWNFVYNWLQVMTLISDFAVFAIGCVSWYVSLSGAHGDTYFTLSFQHVYYFHHSCLCFSLTFNNMDTQEGNADDAAYINSTTSRHYIVLGWRLCIKYQQKIILCTTDMDRTKHTSRHTALCLMFCKKKIHYTWKIRCSAKLVNETNPAAAVYS